MSEYVRLFQIMSDYVRLCKIMSDYVRLGQIMTDHDQLSDPDGSLFKGTLYLFCQSLKID